LQRAVPPQVFSGQHRENLDPGDHFLSLMRLTLDEKEGRVIYQYGDGQLQEERMDYLEFILSDRLGCGGSHHQASAVALHSRTASLSSQNPAEDTVGDERRRFLLKT